MRQTVQLSERLIDAIGEKAASEALPSAAFVRRAVTRYISEFNPDAPSVDISSYAEGTRTGSRGPLRQWPHGVSYVLDQTVAEALANLAEERSRRQHVKTTVADLAREAIVLDLAGPAVPRRPLAQDEYGFTTSDSGRDGRDMQSMMDEAWSGTNE